mgnify:CR=1 FL=1
MKKAKNAFAIIGIILAVVAAALLVLHPVIDGIAASLTEGAPAAMPFSDYLNFLKDDRLPELLKFDWISNFNAEALKVYYPMLAGAVGLVLFVVLFIFLLCKKHAKGLGWFFPMLILFALATIVACFYAIPNSLYDAYLAKAGSGFVAVVTQYLFYAGFICALVAMGSFVLASVFYIVYVCKARKTQKKIAENKKAAIAKIESILGGAK